MPVVLMAGAPSGGHLYPGVALALELQAQGIATVHFQTGGSALEERVLAGFPQHRVPLLTRRHPGRLWQLHRRVSRLFGQLSPAAVVSLGGGSGVVPGLVAAARGLPLFLLEQNAIVGRANRMLLPFCTRLFTSFRGTQGGYWLRRRSILTGCPVRAGFTPTPLAAGPPCLFVQGGSQGALDVNRLLKQAAPLLRPLRGAVRVVHVTGTAAKADGVSAAYQSAGLEAEVCEYLEHPVDILRAASLVVARAGGSTLAELGAMGRPALLLPYPHHKDRQQFLNAQPWVAGGAAELITDEPARLAQRLVELLAQPGVLERRATAARALGHPEAAARIATVIGTHLGALPATHPVVVGARKAG